MPLRELRQKAGSFDLIYKAVGVSSIGFNALQILAPNGIFVFTGVPAPGKPSPLDTDTIMRDIVLKNQRVVGTVNASQDAFDIALRELEQGMFFFPQAVRALITRRHPLEAVPKLVTAHGGIKQVVRLDEARTP